MGTLFFFLVEKLSVSVKLKVLLVTLGHPLVTIIILWFGCSFFSQPIAEFSVAFVCGTLLRIPFSDVKYFLRLVEDSETVSIEYFSELMQKKKIELKATDIERISQSDGRRLIDKPSDLTVSLPDQILTFKILKKISLKLDSKYLQPTGAV
jgi:hypothetical protein